MFVSGGLVGEWTSAPTLGRGLGFPRLNQPPPVFGFREYKRLGSRTEGGEEDNKWSRV